MVGIYKPETLLTTCYALPLALQAALGQKETTCYSQVVKSPEWRAAIAVECEALVKQGTWSLVLATSSQNIVGCKWVFKLK